MKKLKKKSLISLLAAAFKQWFFEQFNIVPCRKCGSWSTRHGHFASGWNNLCNQASGHDGQICNDCLHVEFDEPLEVRRSKAPHWVKVSR